MKSQTGHDGTDGTPAKRLTAQTHPTKTVSSQLDDKLRYFFKQMKLKSLKRPMTCIIRIYFFNLRWLIRTRPLLKLSSSFSVKYRSDGFFLLPFGTILRKPQVTQERQYFTKMDCTRVRMKKGTSVSHNMRFVI